jgi:hypothetical protein
VTTVVSGDSDGSCDWKGIGWVCVCAGSKFFRRISSYQFEQCQKIFVQFGSSPFEMSRNFFVKSGKVRKFFRFSRNFAIISRISPKIPKLSENCQIFSDFHHNFTLFPPNSTDFPQEINLHSHWLNSFQLRSSTILLGNFTQIFYFHVSSSGKTEIFNFTALGNFTLKLANFHLLFCSPNLPVETSL